MTRKSREAELTEALRNVRRALMERNWSLAIGYVERAIGNERKAA